MDYSDIGGLDLQKQEIREAVELPLTHFGRRKFHFSSRDERSIDRCRIIQIDWN